MNCTGSEVKLGSSGVGVCEHERKYELGLYIPQLVLPMDYEISTYTRIAFIKFQTGCVVFPLCCKL